VTAAAGEARSPAACQADAVDVDALLTLWTDPLPAADEAAEAAFARCYADPVTVNGAALPRAALVTRARAMQAAFPDRRTVILDTVATAEKLIVAFELHATHTGPLQTPLGAVEATGRPVVMRTIDILILDATGRIAVVHVVGDELGMLTQLNAVRLVTPEPV